ncbi:MAG: DUF1801 domain-containing protein [Caldilineae bacterium]|nr:DUF1801 domain-containing protein [Anaerolineae bacterium]MCB0252718.1 DUF1801 domain-containing protein [Anaerolineae bacterium]MCB9154599.1 DUF1801 domain-containing protein [Caldilineae bacterium]
MTEKTVDAYIEGLDGWQHETAVRLRGIVKSAAPNARESLKWAQPVYEADGPFCYFKAFKSSLNFGFWRGVDLDDPKGLLEGSGDKMRHVKLTGVDGIDEDAFADFVRQAIELNHLKGDPTKG